MRRGGGTERLMGGDVKLSGGGSLKGRDKILVRGICQNSGWWGGDPP